MSEHALTYKREMSFDKATFTICLIHLYRHYSPGFRFTPELLTSLLRAIEGETLAAGAEFSASIPLPPSVCAVEQSLVGVADAGAPLHVWGLDAASDPVRGHGAGLAVPLGGAWRQPVLGSSS